MVALLTVVFNGSHSVHVFPSKHIWWIHIQQDLQKRLSLQLAAERRTWDGVIPKGSTQRSQVFPSEDCSNEIKLICCCNRGIIAFLVHRKVVESMHQGKWSDRFAIFILQSCPVNEKAVRAVFIVADFGLRLRGETTFTKSAHPERASSHIVTSLGPSTNSTDTNFWHSPKASMQIEPTDSGSETACRFLHE